MKQFLYFLLISERILAVCLLALSLGGCGDMGLPAYRVIVPPLPEVWVELMGEPQWRLIWINRGGALRSAEGPAAALPEPDIGQEWPSPVLAYPFWPGLPPGQMRPAGAVFPFDAEGNRIPLSWEAGVEAAFYLDLAAAAESAGWGGAAAADNVTSADEATAEAVGPPHPLRHPRHFDWLRFRELLRGEDISPEIREDPWRADWRSIAIRTVQSGFDRRRIKPVEREPLKVTIPGGGPWIGSSPFAEVRHWEAGETAELEAAGTVEFYLSPQGLLRYRKGIWIWIKRTE
ncbi:hypothetical protein AGMMS49991_09650 [Spirochaetia bacterium]|nr:hypothetical protein AGMMS49991_09650 [Spirochaetia bacterium]